MTDQFSGISAEINRAVPIQGYILNFKYETMFI